MRAIPATSNGSTSRPVTARTGVVVPVAPPVVDAVPGPGVVVGVVVGVVCRAHDVRDDHLAVAGVDRAVVAGVGDREVGAGDPERGPAPAAARGAAVVGGVKRTAAALAASEEPAAAAAAAGSVTAAALARRAGGP